MDKDKRLQTVVPETPERQGEALTRRSLKVASVLGTWTRRREVEELTGAPAGVTIH